MYSKCISAYARGVNIYILTVSKCVKIFLLTLIPKIVYTKSIDIKQIGGVNSICRM